MSTYGQLKTDVDNWLVRDDVAVTGTSFPSITLIAEAEIARDIRTVIQEQRTQIVTSGARFEVLPTDFLEMRQVFIDDVNGRRFFEYQTPEVIRERGTWLNGRTTAFYSFEGGDIADAPATDLRIVFAPSPDAGNPLTVDLLYWARWPAFAADPDTNWLLENYYDIYLYALLRASCEFIQEDMLEDRYRGKYDAARDKVRVAENRKRYRGNSWQMYGSVRTVV